MRYVKEECIYNEDNVIDFKSAVEGLHALSSQELSKLLRESENFTLQVNAENGSLLQVDMERLAWSLPLHLIAVLVSQSENDVDLIYLLRGIRLLHSLCDLASRNSRLDQILLDEVKVTEQILDLVFYTLVILARYDQETHIKSHLPLLHSTLVACSLHLLTGYVSSQWQDLAHILLVHPKVDVFMDVAFDAVRVCISFFQIKLSSLNNEVLHNKCSCLVAERVVIHLCQQCEASLQFLHSLCQQKIFRERLLRNKELCKNGGILSLARAVLKLNVPQSFKETISIIAATSRWKSKVLSILLQLCETESISYLDEVASSPKSMYLAKSVALEVLELLKAAFICEPKERVSVDSCNPKGLVILNSMRLADIFSDDSNFRSFIMTNITQVLADILALPHDEFLGGWCSTDLPLVEEDAILEYDPYNVAGVVLISIAEGPGTFLSYSHQKETNAPSPFVLNNTAPVSHARQRTSFLVKIIANLHCFNPKICEEQERDQFFNKFLECIRQESSKASVRYSLTSEAQKNSTISENLCSLCSHAVSLIPSLLNEEDVQLLSEFFEQLQGLLPQHGNSVQDSLPNVRGIHDNKVEGPIFSRQTPSGWESWDKFVFSERSLAKPGTALHHSLYKRSAGNDRQFSEDTQSTGRYGTNVEDAQFFKDRNDILNEEICKASLFQEAAPIKTPDMDIDHANAEFDKSDDYAAPNKSASGSFRDTDRDMGNSETASLSNSVRLRNCTDQMSDNGELTGVMEHAKGNNEKAEASLNEEKQPRKRKRNIMNMKQIALIEEALLDEPEMQRNASLLQSWADKLSLHGSELTSSQLKNWLNNRKARLARAAREARTPSEGENAYMDKPCGSTLSNFYDSPESPGEDFYIPLASRGNNQSTTKYNTRGLTIRTITDTELPSSEFAEFSSQHNMQFNGTSSSLAGYELGRLVCLLDGEGKEVGQGRVFQVRGKWQGICVEDDKVCIVDIHDLKVERWNRVPYASETLGMTFDEAEAKHGVMRVAWDANKIV